MVDVGCRLSDDLKTFGHELKAIFDSVEESPRTDRALDLSLSGN